MFLRAYLFLSTTTLFWAANAVAGRLAVGHISPFLLTSFRWGLAALAAGVLGWRYIRRDLGTIRAHWPLLVAMGTVGFMLFNVTYYTAAKYTTAINITIIQAGMPLIIFLANFALFRIRVTGWQVAGFLLTLAGILTVAAQGSLQALLKLHLNHGDALMLLAITFYGLYTAALRWKPAMHWLSFMAVTSTGAFGSSLLFTGYEIATGSVIWPDARGLAIGVFTGLFPGLIAQATFVAGAELIGSNRAALFINMVPIVGAMLAVVLLGEHLHLYHLAALVLVLAGVTLAQRRQKGA